MIDFVLLVIQGEYPQKKKIFSHCIQVVIIWISLEKKEVSYPIKYTNNNRRLKNISSRDERKQNIWKWKLDFGVI